MISIFSLFYTLKKFNKQRRVTMLSDERKKSGVKTNRVKVVDNADGNGCAENVKSAVALLRGEKEVIEH